MALSRIEREEFLSQPHIASLSVESTGDREPLSVPMWYQYVPGEQPWLLTQARSRKADLIRAAGRFTLMVNHAHPSVRYVSVGGPANRIEPGTDDQLELLARRYLSGPQVDAYLQFARADSSDRIAIYLEPQHWLSGDLGPT